MKPDSRDLVDEPILTLWHRPHSLKLPPLHPLYFCCRRLVLPHCTHHLPVFSLRCLFSVVIHGKHYEFSIFLEALACMLAS